MRYFSYQCKNILSLGKTTELLKDNFLKFDKLPTKQKTYPTVASSGITRLIKPIIKSLNEKNTVGFKEIEKVVCSERSANAVGKSKGFNLYSLLSVSIYIRINQ